MRGRKRKAGRRTSNGRLAREPLPDVRAAVGEQPHRAWLPAHMRLWEKAGDPLGCLQIKGAITEQQYEAGRLYAYFAGSYRAVIGGPRVLGGNGRGGDCNPLACVPEQCECLYRKQRYFSAIIALLGAGEACKRAVENLVLHGRPPEYLVELTFGLDRLVEHFGLTGSRNTANARNTN